MPVYSEINKFIRTQLNEASPIKWSDAEVLQAYDFAQKDWSIRTECLATLVSIASVAGTQTYALTSFPRFLKFRKVIWDYGTTQAIPLKWFDYQDYPWPIQTQTNIPSGYTVHDDKLLLYFTPNSAVAVGGLYLFSASDISSTVAFSANNYTNPIIPERHQLYAANLSVAVLARKFDNGREVANTYNQLYEKYVNEQISLQRRPSDDTRQQYFKTYSSPAFNGSYGDMGAGYTGRPLF